jgi:hypothetical protein
MLCDGCDMEITGTPVTREHMGTTQHYCCEGCASANHEVHHGKDCCH